MTLQARDPIAIIGTGLRLPGADSLDGFWEHLAAAKSLIAEVPRQRWDPAQWKGDPARANKTNSVWGGFVVDADCFDAAFFSISPREAAWMDPQQRFALEMAWHAIEDAGYAARTLAGTRTGVFIGVCHWDYAELLEKHLAQVDAYTPTGIAFSIIANRISHFFDFQGPSVTNDTACAASLTSVHDAVRALQAGECDLALAGGVNLIWSPNHFVSFAKAGMLSRTGRAKAFDDDADGYVRGEGGAVLLLKPLAKALADHDPIHAVIRGVGINHGGRTNSLTVTNPKAQAELIVRVHGEAGITPGSVSYVEAHGPGTPLGDPIEIAGLKEAFTRLHAMSGTAPGEGACGIGSVKTNIGHLEGAAGVAGMVKILAALRHGILPANAGFERLNRLIDLDGSDFHIQGASTPWPHDPQHPRRAAVSSFGFGGSNAHLVMEEAPARTAETPQNATFVFPLSAKTEARLPVLARALLDFLQKRAPGTELAELAITLQTGREPMEARLAILAADWDVLAAALQAAANGQEHPSLFQQGSPNKLAAAWLAGGEVDWRELWPSGPLPHRIHAPLYPFERVRHWMDESLGGKDDAPVPHPLLHRNLSDFSQVRYRTLLKGPEFFWADHHVGGKQVLPGVVMLEMVRAAVQRAGDTLSSAMSFENVAWTRPVLASDGPVTLDVQLTRKDDGSVAFTVFQDEDPAKVNFQGIARHNGNIARESQDIAALLSPADKDVAVDACYDRLKASGVHHGPAFQALAQVRAGNGQVMAQLKLGRRLHPTLASLSLHPVLLDAAIQAWVGLDGDGLAGAAVPFACKRIDVFGPCEPVMWAHVRDASASSTDSMRRLDIDLIAKDGSLRVAFHDLALRLMSPAEEPAASIKDEAEEPFLAVGQWQASSLSAPRAEPMQGIVLLAGLPETASDPSAIALPAADPENLAATLEAWFAELHRRIAILMQGKARQRQQILIFAAESLSPCLTAPLAALLKTAAIEQPKLEGAVIRLAGAITPARLAAIVKAERQRSDAFAELRYDEQDRRFAWMPAAIALPQAKPALDPAGVYWITGGLGGLGLIFARWLAARGAKHIILSGRRPIAEGDHRLAGLSGIVRTLVCDVTDPRAVEQAVSRIASEMGPLKGIIHAAGILNDGYILTREPSAEGGVFAPKLGGTLNLDRATRDQPLDFLLLCSSVAATFGNAGQSGYAAANAFMDAFAGQQNGTTISIAWPLWAEGGMQVDAANLAALNRRFGTVPMPTATGVDALDRILAAKPNGHVIVLHGKAERLRQTLEDYGKALDGGKAETSATASDATLAARTVDFVREILAGVLQLGPSEIRANRKLEEYGLDSIAIVEATNRLEESLGPLSKTLFFEYVDLAGIAAHLAEEHGEALSRVLAADVEEVQPVRALPAQAAFDAVRQPAAEPGGERKRHDIAIVGLSLRVAKAADQKSFWDMLANGQDGFEPYPADRWNHAAILHPERDVLGKTVVRTGAFLDRIDAFDPRYFRISQYEAELMSPEVRLFLEASVEAFEDAGYSRETLQRQYGGDVAVIVGSMTNEYDLYGFQNMLMRGALASGSYTGTIPNMVSYFYGFTGPSYFLDTMCSASSTCVHEAVHMLRAGRCKMALAGGVSLLLHPQKLIATSQEHFTSKTAEVIRGYGLGADGTILGEGVGALVLKTLEDAERDGDHIYGVIRGTAISNAGIRNGFTVPNPRQQAVAIEQALQDAGIDARTIGYIEGHGSGTSLGDPIEIKALTQVFAKHGVAPQSCPIGTVKSNIAHLLAASGLAGIAKVLAQMAHGQLAPSLHAETLNPNIPFEPSPFYVQRQLAPWARLRTADGNEIPRRAGVTSIGAGGMNSHIVIEEYLSSPLAPALQGPQLLVFSAMSETALISVAERFLNHLNDQPLADLAYTLQTGKNELPCRLAFVADCLAEVAKILRAFIGAPGQGTGWHYSRSILNNDPDTIGLADAIQHRDLEQVATAWITGAEILWDDLHQGERPHRLSLPAYPFEKVRCWYHEYPDAPSVIHPLGAKQKLHPLVGVNRSDLEGLQYTTAFYLDELLDYRFKQDRKAALISTASVEAVAALSRIAGLEGPLTITGMSVTADVPWDQVTELTASVAPIRGGVAIRLNTVIAGMDPVVWAKARVTIDTGSSSPPISLAEGRRLDGAEIYATLARRGLDFQPYLNVIDHALIQDDGSVLCALALHPPQQDSGKRNVQLPAPVLSAAFQALLLAAPEQSFLKLAIIEQVRLFDQAAPIVQVLARPSANGFDLWFLADDGSVAASIENLQTASLESAKELSPALQSPGGSTNPQTLVAAELQDIAASILKFPPEQIGLNAPFHDLGFDSISLTRFAQLISTAYGLNLSPAIFFECEHLNALSAHLTEKRQAKPQSAPPARAVQQSAKPSPVQRHAPVPHRQGAIAIIGMAGRFPGSPDIDNFFDHLLAGHDLIGDLPLDRYSPAYAGRMNKAAFTKRGGFLDDIDQFDAAFFRISPTEAMRMDPQQRLLLTTVWRALEDAGYQQDELPADTAVLIGASNLDYAGLLRAHDVACDGYVATGNSLAMIANRISYFFNLHGPSETVDTACSSSLIALLRAADALRNKRCSAALAGGVNLALAIEGFEGPQQAGMLSPEGRCKTFGAGADGYVRGEGVAVLLLKRLEDAERDGDRIVGVLIGGAENHGGRAGSLTAPNATAQADLVQAAMAGIDPFSISYIEAHGTGTALGDPVEANGLRRAYEALMKRQDAPTPFIGLGSVKSNIGHLEAAAGMAGAIKVLMAMRKGILPASLHCTDINPHMDLAGSPFHLVRENQSWQADGPRRAAISSFGFGGANAHVVLEDYAPSAPPRRHSLPPHLFAQNRYWLPLDTPAPLIMVPSWTDRPLPALGHTQQRRRLVIPCAIEIAPGYDAEIVKVVLPEGDAARRYAALAQTVLETLRAVIADGQGGDVLIQLAVPMGDERQLYSGLGGMLDCARLESARLSAKVIEVEANLSPEALARLLASEASCAGQTRVRYIGGHRQERVWTELPAQDKPGQIWKQGGVTLITGGMGALGRILARHIAATTPGAVLVLAGTAPEDADRTTFLNELRSLGAVAAYRQVDIADGRAVTTLVAHIVETHGGLDVAVHCAGVLKDGYIARKSLTDLETELAPKAGGALALLQACSGLQLERLILFGSMSGVAGNIGQAGYAAANGFLDALANLHGQPLVAIDWPLWQDGSMRIDGATGEALFNRMGQRPLDSRQGLAALNKILAANVLQAAVMAGDEPRIRSFFAAIHTLEQPQAPAASQDNGALTEAVASKLCRLLSDLGGFAPSAIRAGAALEDYGIDSLMITRLNASLSGHFAALPMTLFFEFRTLNDVASHLAASQPSACQRWTGANAPSAPAPTPRPSAAIVPRPKLTSLEPIAVIGISGRYPGAKNLDSFWANLLSGHDAVGEIPPGRWDMDGFFHPNREEAVERGLSYAKWGGFLDGFADFDPLFFKISPRDAAAMDPQERLFLMAAWEACEDAGYGPERLASICPGNHGARVGVFAGATKTGFALHGPFVSEGGAVVRPMTSFASIASRVSHALNLCGPSIPVDTMCSSSLVAIHEACEHLRSGSADMALAGGVNLYLHPANFIDLCAVGMLSPDGCCRSFGQGANGFVPGEGVGCLLLKPLSRALADGDRIHALIRSSAVNHGGHSNGYTVPNPAAQRDLMREALAKAELNARAVTCIEAHGTGTELGDPIEATALAQAFAADTEDKGFCALGSVKSAIGHLEAAAGIAGVTKIILQMKHGMLAPSLHAQQINPNLNLDTTPFVLQHRAAPWRCDGPRIAGVSSFGASGVNAHVILEEWADTSAHGKSDNGDGPQAVLLSARTPECLRQQAIRLLAFLEQRPALDSGNVKAELRQQLALLLGVDEAEVNTAEPFDSLGLDAAQRLALWRWIENRFTIDQDIASLAHQDTLDKLAQYLGQSEIRLLDASLASIAYTLQVGREAMAYRLALETDTLKDLAASLRAWLDGQANRPGLHTGQPGENHDLLDLLGGEIELQEMAARWWSQGRLDKILALWVKGLKIDWQTLPRRHRPSILSLPTYPFEQQRFWLPGNVATAITGPNGEEALQAEALRLDLAIANLLAARLEAIPAQAIVPAYQRWHDAARQLLNSLPAQPGTTWAEFRAKGESAAQMKLAETTLNALPDILTGRRPATAVMFPQGSTALVEAVYKDNLIAARFNRALARAAESFVRQSSLPSLRILEIGAGTGGTSEVLFEALAPHWGRIAEYCYTDVSQAFLIHAQRAYGPRLAQLTTRLFDVEKPPQEQGLALGGYDLVIAANVLHATADMTRTLAHAQALLAQGGMLLINETSMATLFTHVTFGLLDGWWRFTDPALRIPGTPSLAPQIWRSLLEGAGLNWVAGSQAKECALGQQIIAARKPGTPSFQAALPAPYQPILAQNIGGTTLREKLLALLGETLNLSPAAIVLDRPFADYGLDSILGAELARRIRNNLNIDFDQTRLYDFATAAQLETFLAGEIPSAPLAAPILPAITTDKRQPIAIVGQSGRFAGSPDLDALWSHLIEGDDLVTPATRFDLAPFYRDAEPGSYGDHGSFIEGVENFDPTFFGISGLEATYMDPQQRLFLEEAWKTLENAGHAGDDIAGQRLGVFVGCSSGDYQELFKSQPPGQAFWGNTSSLIPSRIAYFLDLKGPAVAIDTACSSSLVAVHMACQSLWNGELKMALAGGVFIHCTPRFFRYANQAKMLSPSGHCAPFGAKADGIVPGEAVAAVLLRPLADALADGDTIHGVIVGTGLNQDGATNGITAPSAISQERLIRQVQSEFAIDPASIGLVEAHGTGTILGDPIEHAALARAFKTGQPRSCALGSVKSNIGHATTAAGIAGFVKALQCLRHCVIPPTLHFDGGNPAIRFDDGPFFVNTQTVPWNAPAGTKRRAAISSFGFSGTNAHVVIEEAPAQPVPAQDNDRHLFVLSARSAGQLRQQAENLFRHLQQHKELAARDVAFTLLAGRRHLHHRLAVVAGSLVDLNVSLRAWLDGALDSSVQVGELDSTFRSQDAPLAPTNAPLDQLARQYLDGARLDAAQLFGPNRRRVPLPAYPFAAIRHWVEQPAIPVPTPHAASVKAAPRRLADPAQLDTSFTARPATLRTTLAPLETPNPLRRTDTGKVRHLMLPGDFGADQLACELAAAAKDETIHVVVISGLDNGHGMKVASSPLPIVVVATADGAHPSADFIATDVNAAMALAEQIAQAPRLALLELKRTMRQPGRLPPPGLSELETLLDSTSPPSLEAEVAGQRLPLQTPCMELTSFADGVVLLRLNESQRKNSFTDDFMDGISEAFAAIAREDSAKVVVVTGYDGYFACGGTPEGLQSLQRGETRFTDRKIYSLPLDCPLPVIAAMQGHAIGAGWSLGMFCDVQLFAAEAVYHSNYLRLGFTPGAGATLIFPHRLGDQLGREVLFTAHEYRGRDLKQRWPGLRVLPASQVLPTALALAHGLAALPREKLLALKAEAAQPIAQRLPAVFAQELAMHEKTFINNLIVQERIGLMTPPPPSSATGAAAKGGNGQLRDVVVASLAEDLMIGPAEIRDGASFLELGLDSILAVTWIRRLNDLLKVELSATAVYAHPTVGALVDHLAGKSPVLPPAPPARETASPAKAAPGQLRDIVVASLAEDLMIGPAEIRDGASFLELGLDSILAVTWIRRLNGLLKVELSATAVYAHPTVGALIDHLAALAPITEMIPAAPTLAPAAPVAPANVTRKAYDGAVAIIGASGRFPKSSDLDAFWDNIRQGRDCIEEVPADRWDVERFYHPDPLHPGTSYCRWMGAIDDVDRFDAPFFNITPREAELMDPQQRLFLEHAWHAIEDAALSPEAISASRCGIFVGAGPSGYADLIDEHNAYSLLGRSGSILAARIAHLLDLRGPCISLDTACSSSLVAIAQACNSLLTGDSDLALTGGVSVMIGPGMFIDTSKVSMLSKDGRCFTFDQRANGFVPGEGIGVLLLKRREDAERDGDPIHAVIRGWGVNQDGRTNGITAPNPQAQTRLMRGVYERFAIDPASIGLIEAHGTGTPLGDPIEIEGLTDAFAGSNSPAGSCALGSVKSNIGHLLAAAGVAGALKAMLAVKHHELPPTIHFVQMNEHISLKGTAFAINDSLKPWPQPLSGPRRVGVSAFGFSGTNAHAVIEEYPQQQASAGQGPWVFVLSAQTAERLTELAGVMERFISAHPETGLGDLAHTLQIGRKVHPHRLAVVAKDRDGLLRALASVLAGRPVHGAYLSSSPSDPPLTSASLQDRQAHQWVKGTPVEWRTDPDARRIHLPGYPFARHRYWVTPRPLEQAAASFAASHRLLDTMAGPMRFPIMVRGDEPHLTSHATGNERMLLGLFLLELAREAAEKTGGKPVRGLRHLLWGKPLRVNGHARDLSLSVSKDGDGMFYQVAIDGNDDTPCHVGEVMEDGAAMPDTPPPFPAQDASNDVTDLFKHFAAGLAVHSGSPAPEAAQVLEVHRQGNDLQARLRRQDAANGTGFDPLVLDSVWRLAAFCVQDGQTEGGPLPFPLAIRSAWAAPSLPKELLVRIWTKPQARHITMTITDGKGSVLMNLEGVRMAPFTKLDEIRISEESMT